jgi:hypothetical protein
LGIDCFQYVPGNPAARKTGDKKPEIQHQVHFVDKGTTLVSISPLTQGDRKLLDPVLQAKYKYVFDGVDSPVSLLDETAHATGSSPERIRKPQKQMHNGSTYIHKSNVLAFFSGTSSKAVEKQKASQAELVVAEETVHAWVNGTLDLQTNQLPESCTDCLPIALVSQFYPELFLDPNTSGQVDDVTPTKLTKGLCFDGVKENENGKLVRHNSKRKGGEKRGRQAEVDAPTRLPKRHQGGQDLSTHDCMHDGLAWALH